MFRGSAAATIDEKGRLKIPSAFRRGLEESYGKDVFLTSVQGESVIVYPLPVWEELEARLAALPSTDRTRRRFLERVSYYGLESRLDVQGRVVIPPILRQSADMHGEVVVSARLDHLEVWNRRRLEARFAEQPFTDQEWGYLSDRNV